MSEQPSRLRGDHAAADVARFDELWARFARRIHAYCARRTAPDRVDDAVSETFLVAWRRIDDVPAGDDALLWLYRVAFRVVGHEWRSDTRRRRLRTRAGALRRLPSPTPEDRVVADEETRQVLAAASHLNPSDAEILRLLAWERLSHAELATVLDIAPNAVNQRLHRARRNLAREYDRLDAGPVRSPAALEGGAR